MYKHDASVTDHDTIVTTLVMSIKPLLWASHPCYKCHTLLRACDAWLLQIMHVRCLSSNGFPSNKNKRCTLIDIIVLRRLETMGRKNSNELGVRKTCLQLFKQWKKHRWQFMELQSNLEFQKKLLSRVTGKLRVNAKARTDNKTRKKLRCGYSWHLPNTSTAGSRENTG